MRSRDGSMSVMPVTPFRNAGSDLVDAACRYTQWENTLKYFGQLTELNYLTHIVCRLFERRDLPDDSDSKVTLFSRVVFR